MPTASKIADATRLQNRLRKLLGHDQIEVRPHGHHLVIHLVEGEMSSIVARLTEIRPGVFTPGFRNHSGRWEPLPGTGDFEGAAEVVFTCLEPYLRPL